MIILRQHINFKHDVKIEYKFCSQIFITNIDLKHFIKCENCWSPVILRKH